MIHTSKRKQEDYFYNVYLIVNGLLGLLLVLHFYLFGYQFWEMFGFSHPYVEGIVIKIANSFLFSNLFINKLFILVVAVIGFMLMKFYKNIDINLNAAIRDLIVGLGIFFLSNYVLYLNLGIKPLFIAYMLASMIGFFIMNSGLSRIFRYFKTNLKEDLFNKEQESFPQEERKLMNDASVNLPAKYHYERSTRNSWINFVNLYRGLLISGSPGSGKTYFVIRHIIKQLIEKDFTMLVYDFKYPDLTKLTYNLLREHWPNSDIKPTFYSVNFNDLTRSHRVNPLNPEGIIDISDAYQAAKSVYHGMSTQDSSNSKQDPFWEDGGINLLTAIIWTLRKHENGRYCDFPHVLEFLMGDHQKYIPVLMCDDQASKYASTLYYAAAEGNTKLLNNMMSTLKQRMAKLASPNVYWIMSGEDFNLDINNPKDPKILCLANNDQKSHVYSAPLSLIVDKLSRTINQKDKLKCATIFDEFPTLYFEDVSKQIATARQNKIATVLGIQDASQNEKRLGRINSEIIFNITPNIISGSLAGKMAKELSERLGKIKMVRDSLNLGNDGPTKNQSVQMDYAVPVSTINNLTAGEVVGLVADNPDQPIELKRFHSFIQNDHEQLKYFDQNMEELPIVRPDVSQATVEKTYKNIVFETEQIIINMYLALKSNPTYSEIFRQLETKEK
jgi:hypothetical protein